jgi:FkbM family methyltransferase
MRQLPPFFTVCIGLALTVLVLYIGSSKKCPVDVVPQPPPPDYATLPRPATLHAFLSSAGSNPDHVVYVNGMALRLHPEIARVDTFLFPEHPEMPRVVNYAFWADPCEEHIVSNPEKSADWLAVDRFLHFKNLIPPGSVAIDIGAQQGDTTVLMAPFAALTIALEPQPRTFIVTQTNADVNPQFNIHPYNVAAGKVDHTERWCYGCNGGASDTKGSECFDATIVNVPAFLLERYPSNVLQNVGFIKIDTEGFDTQILLTLQPLLAMNDPKPVIQLEWYQTHTSPAARQMYVDAFAAIGYEAKEDILTHPKMRDIVIRPR